MKAKRIFLAMLLVAFAMATQTVASYAADGISVRVNGEQVVFENQQPALVDGRTLVPVRGVFEALGFEVGWSGVTRIVTLNRSDFAVIITVDSDVFTTNGTTHALDVPAQIIGGSTMLPIRAVLESVGYYLDWHGATQTVLISSVPFETVNIPAYITIRGEQFSTSLISLNLESGSLTNQDIEPLRYMTNLTMLGLGNDGLSPRGNQITDLSPLADLTNLELLRLDSNQITDLTPLAGLTNLTWLDLWNNQITDLAPLAGLANLIWLHLSSNQISDLTPLAGLTNLTSLNLGGNLGGNKVPNLTPLAGLTNLESLSLHDSQISDLTPLSGLINLNSLNLASNQISDLSPLAGLTNLTWLVLWDNQISDWAPVAHIEDVIGRP